MKAHKVPATYYSGWEIPGCEGRFYVFYRDDVAAEGIQKRFRNISKITTEHSFFVEENFYYIDLNIDGIEYKLKDEINGFLSDCHLSIKCNDDLSDPQDDESTPIVDIDDYDKFSKYKINMDTWMITDSTGMAVGISDFKKNLNDYIFEKVGKLIEENYFANYLENMWDDVRKSIHSDISCLNSGDAVSLTRKRDMLEFFVNQYLRLDKRIITDIKPTLDMVEKIFLEMGLTEKDIAKMKKDGLLSPKPYFFGILLDAARGNKDKINKHINAIENNYIIDVLAAPDEYSYLTSTSPCVFSKVCDKVKLEMLFAIDSKHCLRFRLKKSISDVGGYYLQTETDVKSINNCVVKYSDDIVISKCQYINNLL